MSNIIIVVFCIAFALGQVARIQMGNIAITALDIVVALIFASTFINYVLRKKVKLTPSISIKYVGLFILSGIVGLLLYSHNLSLSELVVSFLYAIRLVLYLGVYYWVIRLTDDQRKLAFYSLTGAGVFILIAGFLQYYYYPYLRNLYYLGWDDHLYRLFSVFFDPNYAGAFFTVYLLFILDLLRRSETTVSRAVYGAIGLATVVAIFLTHSRTGFIMIAVGVLVYSTLFVSRKMAIISIFVLSILLILTSNSQIEGLNPLRAASSKARIDSASKAIAVIVGNPLFGVGFNSYRYAQVRMGFREGEPLYASHADAGTDNSYLFIIATTGLVGGVFFFLACRQLLRYVTTTARKNHFPGRSVLASLIAVFIGSLFLNVIFYPMIVIWIVVQLGLIRNK